MSSIAVVRLTKTEFVEDPILSRQKLVTTVSIIFCLLPCILAPTHSINLAIRSERLDAVEGGRGVGVLVVAVVLVLLGHVFRTVHAIPTAYSCQKAIICIIIMIVIERISSEAEK